MSIKKISNALPITEAVIKDRNEERLSALKELNQVLKKNPESLIAYKLRGTINLELGFKQEALSDLEQATKLNSEDDSALNLLGIAQLAIGEKHLAMESFSKAILINHRNQQAYFNRGRTRYALGMATEAITDFKQAILIDTEDSKSKLNQNSQNSGIFYQLALIKNALVDIQENEKLRLKKPTLIK